MSMASLSSLSSSVSICNTHKSLFLLLQNNIWLYCIELIDSSRKKTISDPVWSCKFYKKNIFFPFSAQIIIVIVCINRLRLATSIAAKFNLQFVNICEKKVKTLHTPTLQSKMLPNQKRVNNNKGTIVTK